MTSLNQLIDKRHVSAKVMALLQQKAVPLLMQMREKGNLGHIGEQSFVFSPGERELSIFPLTSTPATEREIVKEFGEVLLHAVIASPHHSRRLLAIAKECRDGHLTDLDDLDLRLERSLSNTIYIPIIFIVIVGLLMMYLLK